MKENEKLQKSGNSHKNHRSRLKNKVKNHGLNCLEYHEILELLLTYSIPRKDTNPIGHNLIEFFGSFSHVLDANYHDLMKVDGIGPESALFLSVLSQVIEMYNKSKSEEKKYFLNSTTACVQFFRDFYSIKNTEFMIMACLNKSKKVLKAFRYNGKDDTEINFDLKQISNGINDHGVNSIVLYHTHPFGSVQPSAEDVATTQKIVNVCLMNGIDFDDHIILNESEHYSFYHNGLVKKMKDKFLLMFDSSNLFIETIDRTKIRNEKIDWDEE